VPKPRPRTCIYCSAPADSLEHVIPRWIPEHFGLSGEVMTHSRAIGMSRWKGVLFGDFASRIYCDAHHKQINRLFENKPTHDLMKRLFPGRADTLSRDEQTRLAAWAVKTCYAQWGMVRRRVGVPKAHRAHLIDTGEPHPSVFVGISRSTGEEMKVIFARNHIESGADGSVSHTYDFVLALGHLVFKVWGPTSRVRSVAYKVPTAFATRVWPIHEEVARWPPGRVLDADGLMELWDYDPRAFKTSKECA
jgi:hypothetical protein